MSMHSSDLTLKVFNEPIYSSSFIGKALSSDKKKRKNHYQTGTGIENFDVADAPPMMSKMVCIHFHKTLVGNCCRGYTCAGMQQLSQTRGEANTCHSLLVSLAGIQNQAFTIQRN